MVKVLSPPEETPKLIDADRCDGHCPAQALVRFRWPDDGWLDFCGHHADDYTVALLAVGAVATEDRRLPEPEHRKHPMAGSDYL